MAYCTIDDIKTVIPEADLIQLTDDDGLGVVDQARVTAAIAAAGDLADGYLRGKFTLPVSPVPKVLMRAAVDLSIYYLYERRMKLKMPEPVQKSYDNAVKLLLQIQTGKLALGIDGTPTPTSAGKGEYKTNKTADDRMFPTDVLDQY